MKSFSSRARQEEFWQSQYAEGETKGPAWYQYLKPWIATREQVAFEMFKENVPTNKKMKIVDLGCGEGDLASNVALSSKNFQVTGLDVSANRLTLAQKNQIIKKIDNISFQKHDLNDPLPFKNGTVDVAFSLSVIEYVFDPYFLIKEIQRVLKPGGTLIVEVPNIAYLPERVKLLFGILPSWPDAIGWQGGRLHAFTQTTLVKALENSEFKVNKTTGVGFLRPLRAWWASLLCGEIVVVAKLASE